MLFLGAHKFVCVNVQDGSATLGRKLPSEPLHACLLSKQLPLLLLLSHKYTLTHPSHRASFIAGLLGTAATNPIDVVKSRMMNQAVTKPTLVTPIATPAGAVLAATSISTTGPVPTTHVYKNSFDCFFTVSLCDDQNLVDDLH